MRTMMSQLKLTVSEEKTRLCRVPPTRSTSWITTFGRHFSPVTERTYLGSRPSKKSVRRVVRAVTEATARNTTLLNAGMLVEQLNALLRRWAITTVLGPVSRAYRALDARTTRRLRRWLCMKNKDYRTTWSRYPDAVLRHGLLRLRHFTRNLPWATA